MERTLGRWPSAAASGLSSFRHLLLRACLTIRPIRKSSMFVQKTIFGHSFPCELQSLKYSTELIPQSYSLRNVVIMLQYLGNSYSSFSQISCISFILEKFFLQLSFFLFCFIVYFQMTVTMHYLYWGMRHPMS